MTTDYAAISGLHLATAAPTVNDDFASGYLKNSLWINTSSGGIWFCRSDAKGAADWLPLVTTETAPNAVAALKNNATGADPTTGDDTLDGYAAGSIWVNTSDLGTFICVDASEGAADWNEITFV